MGSPFQPSDSICSSAPPSLVLPTTSVGDLAVETVYTTAFKDQKPGTSGLRKRVKRFQTSHYLENFVQCCLDEIVCDDRSIATVVLSGDGRFYNENAAQVILRMLAANGFRHVIVGRDFLLSTPAVSALIRQRHAIAGIILTASHNPGGPDGDFGVKLNVANGGAAPEKITNAVFARSLSVSEYHIASMEVAVNVSRLGVQELDGGFRVEVVDGSAVHIDLLRTIFDFDAIRTFLHQTGFRVLYDAMHGVAGPTARALLVDAFGLDADACLLNATPLPDFGGGHPDPNLVYAHDLVTRMGLGSGVSSLPDNGLPDLGCAGDGDMDRNMILGKRFFVTPSDSLAIIAANAATCIPAFKHGLQGLARSMPTSGAVDLVALKLGVPLYEVPTGWKFFCNLMDTGRLSICGEESFGTGSDHIREKDGMWPLLAWLSILQERNARSLSGPVTVEQVVHEHWRSFGRNFYTRYDYEDVDADKADAFFEKLRQLVQASKLDCDSDLFELNLVDEFEYSDPVDGTVARQQGVRLLFHDGSRIVFRRSGTGSVGATIRLYVERYEQRPEHLFDRVEIAVQPLIQIALRVSCLREITGRCEPTVIT